jgi:hypothetical protein
LRAEVQIDSKGHVNLAEVRTKDYRWYLAEEDADGTIHLIPAILVPAVLQPLLPPRAIQMPIIEELPGEWE